MCPNWTMGEVVAKIEEAATNFEGWKWEGAGPSANGLLVSAINAVSLISARQYKIAK
jgi:hypothetical protein